MRKKNINNKVLAGRQDVNKFLYPCREASRSMTTAGGYFLRDDPTLFEPQLFLMNLIKAAVLDPALKKLLEVIYKIIKLAGVTLN